MYYIKIWHVDAKPENFQVAGPYASSLEAYEAWQEREHHAVPYNMHYHEIVESVLSPVQKQVETV